MGYNFWSEEEAKQAYELMLSGRSGADVACLVPYCDKGATRNGIIGLVNRYVKRNALPSIQGAQTPRPPKPQRPKKPKIVTQKPKVVKSVKVRSYEEVVDPLWVRFLDLEAHHCRWPVGVTHGVDSTYCGHTKSADSPYCNAHALRAYNDQPIKS